MGGEWLEAERLEAATPAQAETVGQGWREGGRVYQAWGLVHCEWGKGPQDDLWA